MTFFDMSRIQSYGVLNHEKQLQKHSDICRKSRLFAENYLPLPQVRREGNILLRSDSNIPGELTKGNLRKIINKRKILAEFDIKDQNNGLITFIEDPERVVEKLGGVQLV